MCTLFQRSLQIRAFLAVFAAFFLPQIVHSQIIQGTIKDGKGRPVEGARVRVENTRTLAFSDSKGRYLLRGLNPKNGQIQQGRAFQVEIVASYLNFKPLRQSVEIPSEKALKSIVVNFNFAELGLVSQSVNVQATRTESRLPHAQTEISEASIDEGFKGQDIQFVLEKNVPSLISFSEAGTGFSNYGSFRLRGIDQTRINVTFNGVPLNDMIDQGVFFSNLTDLGNSVRSIQVQRGVGASSNGTSSYGGSVNLESVSLMESSPGADLQVSAGAFNLLRASAELKTGRMANNFSFYAKYSTFATDGYRINTGSRSQSFVFSGGYTAENESFKVNGLIGRTQSRLGYLAVPLPLINQDTRTNINDSTDRDDFGQHLLQLEYTRSLGGLTLLSLSAYYGGAGGDYFAGFRDTAGMLTQINYPLRNDHIGVMASLTTSDSEERFQAAFGLHAYTFLRRNWESLMPDYFGNYYDDRTVKNEASAFAKASYKFGDLLLYGDIQARYVEMRFTPDVRALSQQVSLPAHTWFFLNPKIGATFQISDELSFYGSFGRTGREPTRFDLLGSTQIVDGNVNVLLRPNTVKPEFVNDFEAGLRFASEGIRAELNGFYMDFQNEIAAIGPFIPQGFVQLRKNVESSFRAGAEATFEFSLAQNLRLSGNATFMQARIREFTPENLGTNEVFRNVRPVQTPDFMGFLKVQCDILPELTLELSVRHVGASFLELTNNPELLMTAFTVLDSRIEWRFWGDCRLSLAANNLLNERYFTNGGTAEFGGKLVPALFVQAPRHIFAMVSFKI